MFSFVINLIFFGKVLTQCPHNYTGSYPYDKDCHLFYDCWKGRGVVQTCPPGTAFHATNLECDYVRKVAECFVDVPSTREHSCVMGDDKLLPVDDDCSKFVRCANGLEYLFDCPAGTKFDRTTLICDHAYKVNCNNDVKTDVELNAAKSTIQCPETDFMCDFNKCLNKDLMCNEWKDCDDNSDESNCHEFLEKFVQKPKKLQTAGIRESWMNINVFTCSRLCLETTGFICKGFNYRMLNGICDLSDENSYNTLVEANDFEFYEIKQEPELDYEVEDFNIRLRGSSKINEGRIEVKIRGQWGHVCDDQFDMIDAAVVCRQLGFKLGAAQVKSNAYFMSGLEDNQTQFWMDNVECFGNESSLSQCPFSGWGVHDCMPKEVVGVACHMNESYCSDDYWTCKSGDECVLYNYVCDDVFDCYDKSDENPESCNETFSVRLSNGTSGYDGRIEVRHNGIWGTICDDNFDNYAAKVVCNSLGLRDFVEIRTSSYYGDGRGPIWLDQIVCDGTEDGLDKCLRGKWAVHNCDHGEDVGIVCSNQTTKKVDLKKLAKLEDPLKKMHCGRRNFVWMADKDVKFRVVSSQRAEVGEYPWQASIRIKKHNESFHWCGAVIVADQFILTSAHCLQGYKKNMYIVRVGDYNSQISEQYECEFHIEDFFIHEAFKPGRIKDNDIAVIKLKKRIPFNGFVSPICLPSASTVYTPYKNCTISGFGTMNDGVLASSNEMRSAWIPLLPSTLCKSKAVYGNLMGHGMFCAGHLEGGVDTCEGDSGGPLACRLDGYYTLFGITSWGKSCGKPNQPGVYVKVSKYIKWIENKINKSS